jgi:hypothetical protein
MMTCAVRSDAHHEVGVEKDAVADGLAKALDHRRTPPARSEWCWVVLSLLMACVHERSCEPTIRPPTEPIQFKAWFDKDIPETVQNASVNNTMDGWGGVGVRVSMRAFQLQAHVGEPTECRTRPCRTVHSGASTAGIEARVWM